MKRILLFILLTGSIVSQGFTQESTRAFNTFYTDMTVDSLPTYPGGETEFYQTLQEKFRVNSTMRRFAKPEMNYLTMGFMVDTAGNYSDLQFYESDNVHVEKEIERVMAKMSRWNPAWLHGEKVNTYIYIPVNYTLSDNEFLIKNTGLELLVTKNKSSTRYLKWILAGGVIIFFMGKWI